VAGDFRIVLFTGRPSVATFFSAMGGRRSSAVSATTMGRRRSSAISTTTFDVSPTAVARAPHVVAAASVAVVDASVDPAEALEVCRELPTDLRIGILFCCSHAATSDSLRPFLHAGIGSFLDLELSAEQTLVALRAIARGQDVFRLHLSEDSSTALFGGHSADEPLSTDDLTLLRLVALGLTDNEIGDEMHLSRHTIKHRIERLRRRQQVRNRVQLAAYAARLESLRDVSLS
jgi:DNA-binding NarL/FixJ family response regulator